MTLLLSIFFITASRTARAERRYNERVERGEKVTLEGVEDELAKRDLQDESRDIAPLRPAEDALLIDTTGVTVDQVVSMILECIRSNE